MAVDKAKVVARLKALFPKANLSQKRLDAIADKLAKKPAEDADDAAIDAVINDFNDVLSIEEIAKDDDRVRSLEAEKVKKLETSKKKAATDTDETIDDVEEIEADAPAWAKAILKSNKLLKDDFDTFKSGKVTETKRQQAQALFEKSAILKNVKPEIKERWVNRVNLESEVSFDDQIKELEVEYSDLLQLSADANQYGGGAGSGQSSTAVDQKEVDAVVDNIGI